MDEERSECGPISYPDSAILTYANVARWLQVSPRTAKQLPLKRLNLPGQPRFSFEPDLPPIFPQLRFRVHWRDRWLDAQLTRDLLRLTADRDRPEPIPTQVRGRKVLVTPGEPVDVPL